VGLADRYSSHEVEKELTFSNRGTRHFTSTVSAYPRTSLNRCSKRVQFLLALRAKVLFQRLHQNPSGVQDLFRQDRCSTGINGELSDAYRYVRE